MKTILYSILLLSVSVLVAAPPEDQMDVPPGSSSYRSQESKRQEMMQKVLEKTGESHFRYAMELASGGFDTRALRLLEDFIVLYPGHNREFTVRTELGKMYGHRGNAALSEEHYRAAFRLDPDSERGALALLEAGRIHLRAGRFERAIQIFEEINENLPHTKAARIATTELNSVRILDRSDGN